MKKYIDYCGKSLVTDIEVNTRYILEGGEKGYHIRQDKV